MQPTYYSDVSKVAEVLRNFSDYRKKPGKRGGGKIWPGLQHFEQADVDRIVVRLLPISSCGRSATIFSLKEKIDFAQSITARQLKDSWKERL